MLLTESLSSQNQKKAIIVSDLHIGSRFFLCEDFERFVVTVSDEYDIILNGDIIDNPYEKLSTSHQRVLNHLEEISYRQKVVWVRGNHDNGYVPKKFGNALFCRSYSIGSRLLVIHGDDFDHIMPRNQAFMKAFRLMHNIRLKLGARPVHVAHYAKKWTVFYNVLCQHVMLNAVNCAKENGFEAVTCGHTHYPEDKFVDGVRYVNTGAWTESPTYYLLVTPDELSLKKIDIL